VAEAAAVYAGEVLAAEEDLVIRLVRVLGAEWVADGRGAVGIARGAEQGISTMCGGADERTIGVMASRH